MKIHFYSSSCFEPWDWENADTDGVGGSETSHVELAWRLARRGYEVTSYTSTPDGRESEWRGVKWKDLKEADFSEDGLWIIYRDSSPAKSLTKQPGQYAWLVVQDVSVMNWQDNHADVYDRIIPLCGDHEAYLTQHHPEMKDKLYRSSNGVRSDLIREIEAEGIKRDPMRLIYASSPDRGLVNLLPIFERAREYEPELELHAYYGVQGIDAITKNYPTATHFDPTRKAIERAKSMPGVHWHGRINQKDLYREWFKSSIWCHPTCFTETSCITCMEAQAMGAMPITRPLWALLDNVDCGILIHGDPTDQLVRARYVHSIRSVAANPAVQDKIRDKMMPLARRRHNWEVIADQWEKWVYELKHPPLLDGARFQAHHAFQHKHAKGKIINIGSDNDYGGLRFRDCVNVDYSMTQPDGGKERFVDIMADARDLPQSLNGQFDTAILGEILEHMNPDDCVKALKCAKRTLRPGGKIIITWPEEDRATHEKECKAMEITPVSDVEYAPGCPASHGRIITKEEMLQMLESAGLRVTFCRKIDYFAYHTGWGMTACLNQSL